MKAHACALAAPLLALLLIGCESKPADVAEEKSEAAGATSAAAESSPAPNSPDPLTRMDSYRRSGPASPGFGVQLADGTESVADTDGEARFNTEAYDHLDENGFLTVKNEPLSTFSIDVDTASYANVRRFLQGGNLPPAGAVRIEELINYFDYDYAPPAEGGDPFAVHVEIAGCPWNAGHRLARIGLKGRVIDVDKRPPSNLVFLLDVSGSMQDPNKLPYVKQAMRLVADQLGENDRVAIVVYAAAAGLVLPPTTGDQREIILSAIDRLEAGGSTNGGQGLRLAYDTATEHFVKGGVNRVLLCTDGDFNVGVTNQSELVDLVAQRAKAGVFLSVLGFGMGNLKDSTMEQLADKGNGNYAYIDTLQEARKVFVEQLAGTLITIAKDVKIQVDFNPAEVAGYRLVGYENRLLRNEDFKDDTKDAGEIGAGHAVTALYELVPAGKEVPTPDVEPSKYQTPGTPTDAAGGDEALTVRLRYKEPDGDASKPLEVAATDPGQGFDAASRDFQWAAAVAQFGLLLRHSKHAGEASWPLTRELAQGSLGDDKHGYRAEFVKLVETAANLSGKPEGMASRGPAHPH